MFGRNSVESGIPKVFCPSDAEDYAGVIGGRQKILTDIWEGAIPEFISILPTVPRGLLIVAADGDRYFRTDRESLYRLAGISRKKMVDHDVLIRGLLSEIKREQRMGTG